MKPTRRSSFPRGFVRHRLHALSGGLAAFVAVLLADLPLAVAHPHVWIVARADILVQNGQIVAVRHRWVFDEGYTKMAIEGLDKNGDGVYDRAELAELADVNVEGLKEFDYFTRVRAGAKRFANGAPREVYLEHDAKGELALHFTLALETPGALQTPDLAIEISDPTIFIDFRFDPKDPVTLTGAPGGCKAVLATPKAAAEELAKLGQAFANEVQGMVNIAVPQEIRFDCAG